MMAKQDGNQLTATSDFRLVKDHGYTIYNIIGEGSYAKVYLAEFHDPTANKGSERDQSVRLACKVINGKLAPEVFVEKFLPRELSIIAKMDHKNIIRVHSIIYMADVKKWFIFMQLGDNGDLLKFVQENGALRERRARILFTQLLSALEYLQSKGIAHRDIKCENILLTKAYNIKLSDFGFARYCQKQIDSDELVDCKTFCGSLQYAAPEILRGKAYNAFKTDIWSSGVLLYIVLNKALPFDEENKREIYLAQMNKRWYWRRFVSDVISVRLKQFLPRLLQPLPEHRASVSELMNHPWITEDIVSRKESTPGGAKEEGPSIMTLKAKPSVPLLMPVVSRINLVRRTQEPGTAGDQADSDITASGSAMVDPGAPSTHVNKSTLTNNKGTSVPPSVSPGKQKQ